MDHSLDEEVQTRSPFSVTALDCPAMSGTGDTPSALPSPRVESKKLPHQRDEAGLQVRQADTTADPQLHHVLGPHGPPLCLAGMQSAARVPYFLLESIHLPNLEAPHDMFPCTPPQPMAVIGKVALKPRHERLRPTMMKTGPHRSGPDPQLARCAAAVTLRPDHT